MDEVSPDAAVAAIPAPQVEQQTSLRQEMDAPGAEALAKLRAGEGAEAPKDQLDAAVERGRVAARQVVEGAATNGALYVSKHDISSARVTGEVPVITPGMERPVESRPGDVGQFPIQMGGSRDATMRKNEFVDRIVEANQPVAEVTQLPPPAAAEFDPGLFPEVPEPQQHDVA